MTDTMTDTMADTTKVMPSPIHCCDAAAIDLYCTSHGKHDKNN